MSCGWVLDIARRDPTALPCTDCRCCLASLTATKPKAPLTQAQSNQLLRLNMYAITLHLLLQHSSQHLPCCCHCLLLSS